LEALEQPLHLVGQARRHVVALASALEAEHERQALLTPADLGLERPATAARDRRQRDREREAVLRHGLEEAERAVDLDAVAVLLARDRVEQALELELAEERAERPGA